MRFLKITVISLIFSICLIVPQKIFSVGIDTSSIIPGLTCGNAESENVEARKCCKMGAIDPDKVSNYASWAQKIPFLGGEIVNQWSLLNDSTKALASRSADIACPIGYASPSANHPDCICLTSSSITPTPYSSVNQMCEKYASAKEKGSCQSCAAGAGYWSSIGCIYGDFSKFLTEIVLGWGIGLAFGVSLLCIIYAAFMMQSSQGSPEKIKKAQELLTSCIMGLMLIIFSIFILRLIGVSILKIPGFS